MRIDEEIHGTGESQGQFDHVKNRLIFVEPHVVIGNGHGLKRDRFGIFKKRIWTPHVFQPFHLQEAILRSHVFGQPKPMVFPRLGEKYICRICLELKIGIR